MELFNIDIHDKRVQFVEAKPAGWAGYVPVAKFYEALEEQGVPPQMFPNIPTDNKCLERAMQDLRENRSYLVRSLTKGRGWSLVVENPEALDLEAREELERLGVGDDAEEDYTVELTAKVERAEDDAHVSTLRIIPEDHPGAPLVREAFRYHRGTDDEHRGMFKCSQDLSVWFSQNVIPWVRGVATRSRGGSYYVMKGDTLTRLESVAKALEQVSTFVKEPVKNADGTFFRTSDGKVLNRTKTVTGGRIIMEPKLATPATIEVLIDSLVNEMDKELDVLDEKIRSESLGVRALDTQSRKVEEHSKKLRQFEELLGIGLEDIRSRLQESESGIGMAKLKVEAEKEEKAA